MATHTCARLRAAHAGLPLPAVDIMTCHPSAHHLHPPPGPGPVASPRCPSERRIPLASLLEAPFDHPLGESTGAAVIFGNTGGYSGGGRPAGAGAGSRAGSVRSLPALCGSPRASPSHQEVWPRTHGFPWAAGAGGVMEAALRTAYELAVGEGPAVGSGCSGKDAPRSRASLLQRAINTLVGCPPPSPLLSICRPAAAQAGGGCHTWAGGHQRGGADAARRRVAGPGWAQPAGGGGVGDRARPPPAAGRSVSGRRIGAGPCVACQPCCSATPMHACMPTPATCPTNAHHPCPACCRPCTAGRVRATISSRYGGAGGATACKLDRRASHRRQHCSSENRLLYGCDGEAWHRGSCVHRSPLRGQQLAGHASPMPGLNPASYVRDPRDHHTHLCFCSNPSLPPPPCGPLLLRSWPAQEAASAAAGSPRAETPWCCSSAWAQVGGGAARWLHGGRGPAGGKGYAAVQARGRCTWQEGNCSFKGGRCMPDAVHATAHRPARWLAHPPTHPPRGFAPPLAAACSVQPGRALHDSQEPPKPVGAAAVQGKRGAGRQHRAHTRRGTRGGLPLRRSQACQRLAAAAAAAAAGVLIGACAAPARCHRSSLANPTARWPTSCCTPPTPTARAPRCPPTPPGRRRTRRSTHTWRSSSSRAPPPEPAAQ